MSHAYSKWGNPNHHHKKKKKGTYLGAMLFAGYWGRVIFFTSLEKGNSHTSLSHTLEHDLYGLLYLG